MNPSEINRAIAELCGWRMVKVFEWDTSAKPHVRLPKQFCSDGIDIPNYHADLNACAEFERTLTDGIQQSLYLSQLKSQKNMEWPMTVWLYTTATAQQRCEAFLRLHGKWEESE